MAFKTQAEIFQALLDGKKIRLNIWADVYYLHLEKGMLKDERGAASSYHFESPCNWSIYEEPKPKKKVTLYRYTYRSDHSPDIMQTAWVSFSFEGNYSEYYALLKTESKEVEYDDV